ncbi:MAG: hypothetical protein OHK0039_45570 [Bacteroidia bacterium]
MLQPTPGKAGPQNIRKMRYADVLLMHAEAAYHTGKEQEARACSTSYATAPARPPSPRARPRAACSMRPTRPAASTAPCRPSVQA